MIPPIFLQSDVSTFHLRPLILYLPFSHPPQTPPQIRPLPATFMAQMSPDIPPSRHTSPQAHRPWFSSWQPATVLSPPTSQNCHYLPHILPCHCQRQGMLNISQSLCSYTNCMQMCRLFPCVICIFLIILYRTAHAAAQTYDLYNVFHMVLRLKGSWKQKFLITVGVLMTFGDINVLYSRGLTEEVLIAICPNLLIWVKDTEVKNCHYTL